MSHFSSLRLIAAGVAVLVAVPSAALADGPYIGFSGGLTLPGDSRNTGQFDGTVAATSDFAEIPAGTPVEWKTDFENGYAINAQVGYAFDNGLRVELDGAYTRNGIKRHSGLTVGGTNIDSADVAVLTRGSPSASNPTVGAVLDDGGGRVSSFGLFGNVFYDIKTGSAFKPYVGAGLGYQWSDVRYRPSGVDVADENDGGLAYQLMAGASYALGERAEVFGQYTWRDRTESADIPLNLLPATIGVETGQSIISGGVRFRFGG